MATFNLPATIGSACEDDHHYKVKTPLEIFPLESATAEPMYVVKNADGKRYIVPGKLKSLLVLLDGSRTLGEVAHALSEQEGIAVSEEQLQQLIAAQLQPSGLLEPTEPITSEPDPSSERKRRFNFGFQLRVSLISPERAAPITKRLTWLYRPVVAAVAVALIALVHLAFYQKWVPSQTSLAHTPTEIIILYLLAVATVLFHEFGHAAACRVYGGEHGPIGFVLYLIFPAFYVDLAGIWRLPGRHRAVIDVGGMYFQLLTTIPLYLLYALTEDPIFRVTIYTVDTMVLFSLNPVFKFDGYWLFSDLSGIVNLQKRATAVVKECIKWIIGLSPDVPTLKQIQGRGRKLLLAAYSVISVAVFALFFLVLFTSAPAQCRQLIASVREVIASVGGGSAKLIVSLGRLLAHLIFFYFAYSLLKSAVFRFFPRASDDDHRQRRAKLRAWVSERVAHAATGWLRRDP